MSAEVLTPFGHAPVATEPDGDVVEALEILLDRARKGELLSFAYATLETNGTVGNGWRGARGSSNLLLGAVTALHVRYTRSWLETCDD